MAARACPRARAAATGDDMFKYVFAWLLGVPAGLLILIYLFTHLF